MQKKKKSPQNRTKLKKYLRTGPQSVSKDKTPIWNVGGSRLASQHAGEVGTLGSILVSSVQPGLLSVHIVKATRNNLWVAGKWRLRDRHMEGIDASEAFSLAAWHQV